MNHHYHITNAKDYASYLATITLGNAIHSDGIFLKNEKHEITEEQLEIIPVEEIREEILEDTDKFNNYLDDFIKYKINYLLAEGFMREEKDRYVFFTDQELEQQLKDLQNTIDSK